MKDDAKQKTNRLGFLKVRVFWLTSIILSIILTIIINIVINL